MGCRQSFNLDTNKHSTETKFDDVTMSSYTFTNIPTVDSRLPVDARQVFKLKQSWKGIRRKMEEAGIEMFIG